MSLFRTPLPFLSKWDSVAVAVKGEVGLGGSGTRLGPGARAVRRGMAAAGWAYEDVLHRLGKPASWLPATDEEAEAAFDAAIDLLRKPSTRSGYSEVYPVGSRWQAKPYVKPGSQRSAGYFDQPRDAAMQVFMIKMGYEPQPASPKKNMNKHGMGRKPVPRKGGISKGGSARMPAANAMPPASLSEQLVMYVDDAPHADSIHVPCMPVSLSTALA